MKQKTTTASPKHIIVLEGSPNTGKTTTLFMLIELLGNHTVDPNNGDDRFLLEYKEQVIVITTAGDTVSIMEDNVKFIKEHPCDIAITASRLSTKILKKIRDYAKGSKVEIEYFDKIGVEDNKEMSSKILKRIDEITVEES